MFDYANDKDGYYIAIAQMDGKGLLAFLSGADPSTTYLLCRYADLDVTKATFNSVISKLALDSLKTLQLEDLRFIEDTCQQVDALTEEVFARNNNKPLVVEVPALGSIFSICKGFPEWSEGMTFKVVQDHSECTEEGCKELEPNFVYTGPVV